MGLAASAQLERPISLPIFMPQALTLGVETP